VSFFPYVQLGYTDAVMNHRRAFLQTVAGIGAASAAAQASPQISESDRQYWVRTMGKVAEPVLTNLAAGTLKRNMPVECVTGDVAERRKVTHLEAIGRLLAGIAPWLEVPLDAGPERDLQQRYAGLARQAIRNGADPQSPDFLNFHEGSQPLVDCGFLAQALLRAPNELWKKLDSSTQKNVAAGLLSARVITPGQNNWLLFAATVEAALAMMGERFDGMRIDYAVRAHQQWYVGDGLYGDGPRFHWDYYNSFVIQPMLLDVLRNIGTHAKTWQALLPDILARARRYAAIQERLISPEGTFPVIGRSICYRTGAFQLLADRGDEAAAGRGGDVRRPGLADGGVRGTPAAFGRELHFDGQSVSLRGRVSALGSEGGRRILERTGGRLDVAARLAGRRCAGGPRDHGVGWVHCSPAKSGQEQVGCLDEETRRRGERNTEQGVGKSKPENTEPAE
jgi:hypothetical protein